MISKRSSGYCITKIGKRKKENGSRLESGKSPKREPEERFDYVLNTIFWMELLRSAVNCIETNFTGMEVTATDVVCFPMKIPKLKISII